MFNFILQRPYFFVGWATLLSAFFIGVYGVLYAENNSEAYVTVGLVGIIAAFGGLLAEANFYYQQNLKLIQNYLQYIVQDRPPNPLLIGSSTSLKVKKILKICHKIASNQYKVRKLLEEQSPEEFEKLNDIESMKSLIDNLHHELKTPMHSILSFSSIGIEKIEKSNRPQPGLQQYFQNIHKSGQRLLKIIDSVVTQVKMEEGSTQLIFSKSNLTDIVRCAVEEMRGLVEDKKQKISLDGSSQNMALVCDFEAIIQVVINLLGNAIKFSPVNGEINVTLRQVENKGGRQLEVSVADQGAGVSEEDKEKIFQRNMQGQNAKGMGGAGLGLSISKEILNLHGGEIWVEDNEEGGAIFKFALPINPICILEEK